LAKKKHQSLLDEDRLFSSKFYNSVYDLSMSRYEEQAKNITKANPQPTQILATALMVHSKAAAKKVDQMKLDELVDHFLVRDSESNI
jgi:hypothetical protein